MSDYQELLDKISQAHSSGDTVKYLEYLDQLSDKIGAERTQKLNALKEVVPENSDEIRVTIEMKQLDVHINFLKSKFRASKGTISQDNFVETVKKTSDIFVGNVYQRFFMYGNSKNLKIIDVKHVQDFFDENGEKKAIFFVKFETEEDKISFTLSYAEGDISDDFIGD